MVGAFLVAGCAGDSGDDEPLREPPSTAALERSARQFESAFNGGDGARADDLLSERCRAQTTRSVFDRFSEDWTKAIGGPPTILSVVVDRPGSDALEAEVSIIESPKEGETQNSETSADWIVEDGEWRHDTC